MSRNKQIALTIGLLLVGAIILIGLSNRFTPHPSPKATDAARTTFVPAVHVVVPSAKSFDEVVAALEANTPHAEFSLFDAPGTPATPPDDVKKKLDALADKDALLILARSDVGERQSLLAGKTVRARRYLIGNPLLAARMIEHNPAVSLYLPLELLVYEDAQGRTQLAYDKRAQILGQFNNERIVTVARMLDEKMEDLVSKAAR
jgi:YD repeat-containing protein